MPATCMKGSVLYSGVHRFFGRVCVWVCVSVCVCVCVLLDTTCAPCFKLISSSVCIFHLYMAICPKPSTSVDIFGYRSKHWKVQADSGDAYHTECITLIAGRHVYYWSCLDRKVDNWVLCPVSLDGYISVKQRVLFQMFTEKCLPKPAWLLPVLRRSACLLELAWSVCVCCVAVQACFVWSRSVCH